MIFPLLKTLLFTPFFLCGQRIRLFS